VNGLKTIEAEQAFIDGVKRRNTWFRDSQKVALTSAQIEALLRSAYRAGYRDGHAHGEGALSFLDKLFGK
jgi:predicted DNA binding protein